MAIIDSILNEIDFELPTTLKVLDRVPYDKLDWTPHPKSMSLGKLAWHIAGIPLRVQQMLGEAEFDLAKSGPMPMPDEPGAISAALTKNMDDLRAYVGTLDGDALKAPFTLRHGDKILQQIPKAAILRSILLNHTYHHRGQLSVYLRLLDIPVPIIYGRSADESPVG